MTDNEQKKEYLNSYKKLCEKIRSLEEQIEALRELEQSAKSPKLSDMPKGSNTNKDLSDYIVKLEKLIKELSNTKLEKEERRLEIERRIGKMSDGIECDILRKRYIELKKWEQICVEIDYSWKQTHRLHSRALVNFRLEERTSGTMEGY